jgi:hypothetical protein
MKTKLGLSAGIVAGAAYFLGLVSGYIPLLLIVGYVLICEENRWLKMSVIKALLICIVFSLLGVILGILPDALSLLNDMIRLFDDGVDFSKVYNVFSFLQNGLNFLEMLVLLVFTFMSFGQKTIRIAPLDNAIKKYLPAE